jgi:acetolactate synthase-1/2/3 large subunit
MADADAKMTGRPAVVAATRAVGAANLAVGVHTAYQDSTPMVVMLGQVDTAYLGREGFQEVDLPAFYAPITKWAATVHRPDRIPELVAHALRVAQSGRPGPTMLAFPADVLAATLDDDSIQASVRAVQARISPPEPSREAVTHIAARLAGANRPVIIAGAGARGGRDALVGVAERYAAGVYTSFRRQDAFPNAHALYLGHLTLGIGGDRLTALRDADLVVVLGCRLSEITTVGYTLPAKGTEVIQVDVSDSMVGSFAEIAFGAVADVPRLLEALLEVAPTERPARDWSKGHAAHQLAAAVPPSRSVDGIDPAQVIGAMADVFPADTVVTNDAGNFSAFLHQHWHHDAPLTQVAPTSGAMGYGLPAAIAVKLASPSRTVLGVAGDGGFTMSAMELETAVREEVDITMVVMRNGLQGTIAMHQARALGRLAGVDIGPMDLGTLASSLGAKGITVTDESSLRDAFKEALNTPGPVLVDVRTDPEVLSPSARLSRLLAPPSSQIDQVQP